MSEEIKDSYEDFFAYLNIKPEKLIEFGINYTIFPDSEDSRVIEAWSTLVGNIKNNEKVYIRGYGRNAGGTQHYQNLYKILLKNDNVLKDPTNNSEPRKLLQNVTGYDKSNNKKIVQGTKKIQNYQVAHIFGKTKNPFLFTAPWNIVWKPKITDPFSGHESRGIHSEKYKQCFLNEAKAKYSEYIREYNQLANDYFSSDRLKEAFMKLESDFDTPKAFQSFKENAIEELKLIDID